MRPDLVSYLGSSRSCVQNTFTESRSVKQFILWSIQVWKLAERQRRLQILGWSRVGHGLGPSMGLVVFCCWRFSLTAIVTLWLLLWLFDILEASGMSMYISKCRKTESDACTNNNIARNHVQRKHRHGCKYAHA